MAVECDFCQREQFGERIYYETDLFYWILGRSPIRPGHTIVIPKRHIANFEELSAVELSELHKDTQRWIPKLLQIYKAVGYNMVINVSAAAGQTVPHLHIHIIPRTKDEVGKIDEVRKAYYHSLPEDQRIRLTADEAAVQIKKLQAT